MFHYTHFSTLQSVLDSISSAYVTDRKKNEHGDLENDPVRIKAILDTFESKEVVNDNNVKPRVQGIPQSVRRNEILDEFTCNDIIISSSFPDVFLLGKCYQIKGSLTNKQRRHLLLQYTGNGARNHDLIFFLFDQLQRHGNINGINAVVRSHKRSFERFKDLVKNPEFQRIIKEAKKDPKGKIAQIVMDIVAPILKIAGNKTSVGALERHQAITKINAMCYRYGMPTLFLTVAIDDVNCCNS